MMYISVGQKEKRPEGSGRRILLGKPLLTLRKTMIWAFKRMYPVKPQISILKPFSSTEGLASSLISLPCPYGES